MESEITHILASLFLAQPPALPANRIAPNLATRLRLLSLPDAPPRANDPASSLAGTHPHPHPLGFLPEAHSGAADDGGDDGPNSDAARTRLIRWLVTDLYPSDHPVPTLDRVSDLFWSLRARLISAPKPAHIAHLHSDIVQRTLYAPGDARSFRIRLDLSPGHADPEQLTVLLVADCGNPTGITVSYENMLPTSSIPIVGDVWSAVVPPMHTPGPQAVSSLAAAPASSSATPNDQDEQDPAEYIGDADDFWAGYSDDEGSIAAPSAPDTRPAPGAGVPTDRHAFGLTVDHRNGVSDREELVALRDENVQLKKQLRTALDDIRRIRDEASTVIAALETLLPSAA
ncbi:uncharacterized protein PFL1_03789 [Pseudozyma flocculosa PF-1]|uniref:Uncharacterized protein n=2 Tax=Pseudozyma flocculosa TaxID=84751 RepID=A0A5C3EX96_9BASI|nr:uncharacterized protein PFL1_03789 [Pseudozyma flocculosa PF-1]EPQ28486.1 hypothetical protein PFL1_03789 [Pseudozyma flocculosa PF-1]SPO36405.1 uncharacterized protein PSFLO_01876 [Pseudozyma flocculosa]